MEPQRCDAGKGVDWIRDGWRAFAARPGMWILLCIVFVLVVFALQWLPLVGSLVSQLIAPALSGGLLLAARAALAGDRLDVGQLFAPLTDERTRNPMLVLGVLFLLANLVVVVAIVIIMLATGVGPAMHAAAMGGGTMSMDPATMLQLGAGALLLVLVAVALWLLVLLLFYYAIPLVLFTDVRPVAALGLSVRGIVYNIVPLLVLSVIWFVLSVIASLPLLLGWLVLLPVTCGAWYASYRDVFPAPAEVPPLAESADA